MKISTKGRYALRVMIDLAEQNSEEYIAMKEVAERQDISLKYLERILPLLVKGGLIEGMHGKGGGYKLTRLPKDYTVLEILTLTEGDLAPVACLECGVKECERRAICKTLPLWQGLDALTKNYFKNITLAEIAK